LSSQDSIDTKVKAENAKRFIKENKQDLFLGIFNEKESNDDKLIYNPYSGGYVSHSRIIQVPSINGRTPEEFIIYSPDKDQSFDNMTLEKSKFLFLSETILDTRKNSSRAHDVHLNHFLSLSIMPEYIAEDVLTHIEELSDNTPINRRTNYSHIYFNSKEDGIVILCLNYDIRELDLKLGLKYDDMKVDYNFSDSFLLNQICEKPDDDSDNDEIKYLIENYYKEVCTKILKK